MYIIMAPIEKRPEKKTENGEAEESAVATETIGDAVAARGSAPTRGATAPATSEAPAQQGQ
jgi:hypothetical protein